MPFFGVPDLLSSIHLVDMESDYCELFGVTPVTELHNELCDAFDGGMDPQVFMRVLRGVDSQLFSGWRSYFEGCLDPSVVSTCSRLAYRMHQLLRLSNDENIAIAMTGCGTSGRVAYLLATHLNRVLVGRGSVPCFHYLISGGDSALLFSNELPEDDPIAGAADLHGLIASHGTDGILVIGITCGLSAPYVAGQLDYLLKLKSEGNYPEGRIGVAVMGFNPVFLSRNTPIEKFADKRSFRDVLKELEIRSHAGDADCILVNPVIGPEAVAGSSRMKGGSAALALLTAICCSAVDTNFDYHREVDFDMAIVSSLTVSQETITRTYQACMTTLPTVMTAVAASLMPESGMRGHVYHVGRGLAGAMACIDSSEMPDTYGSPFDETRAFIDGGWLGLGVKSGDLSLLSPLHRISFTQFMEDIAPSLSSRDSVIFSVIDADEHGPESISEQLLVVAECVNRVGATAHVLEARLTDGCAKASSALQLNSVRSIEKLMSSLSPAARLCTISLPKRSHTAETESCPSSYLLQAVLALKIMLNIVSTYSQGAGRGAIYKGRMINTGPSNDKIYHRCVALIGDQMVKQTWGKEISKLDYIDIPIAVLFAFPRFRLDHPFEQELASSHQHTVSSNVFLYALAELCLLRSIYGTDYISDDISKRNVSDHVKHYLSQVNSPGVDRAEIADVAAVLPVAFLLGASPCHQLFADEMFARDIGVKFSTESMGVNAPSFTVASAAQALNENPCISQLLKSVLESS